MFTSLPAKPGPQTAAGAAWWWLSCKKVPVLAHRLAGATNGRPKAASTVTTACQLCWQATLASTTLLSPLYSSENLLKPPSITTTSLVTPSCCRRSLNAAADAGPRCRLLAQCTTTCTAAVNTGQTHGYRLGAVTVLCDARHCSGTCECLHLCTG